MKVMERGETKRSIAKTRQVMAFLFMIFYPFSYLSEAFLCRSKISGGTTAT